LLVQATAVPEPSQFLLGMLGAGLIAGATALKRRG
jgi:hypothetical protein